MKSKILGKKSIIAAVLAIALLIGGSFFANAYVVRPRIKAMEYEREYCVDTSSDGLYLVKYEPDEKLKKIANIMWFIGTDYGLDSAVVPSQTNGIPIKEITEETFSQCPSVKSVTITTNITAIGAKAFLSCENLEKVYIPSSVSNINKSAFVNCKKMTLYVEKGSYAETYAKNGKYKYSYYSPSNDVKVENNLHDKFADGKEFNNIRYSTFYDNGQINCAITDYIQQDSEESVTVPDKINGIKVTAISSEAFVHAAGVKTIILPSSIKSIGHDAFSDCPSLEKVEIKDNVTYIDKTAFDGSSNTVIYASENSYAETFAKQNKIKFAAQQTD